MLMRLAAAVVFGMSVCMVFAGQPSDKGPRSPSEAKTPEQPKASGVRAMIGRPSADRSQPTANARMVLMRFVIAQVTLRDGQAASAKPAASSPARSSIVAMPGQSLFDPEQLNKQLQASPVDLRATDDRIDARLTGLMPDRAVEIVTRGQLAALDCQPAFVQVGQREPRISGVQMSHLGRSNVFTVENVGTIVAFKPRVDDSGRIFLQVDVEKSQLGPVEDGAVVSELSNGEKIRTPQVEKMCIRTTVGLVDGQPLALAGLDSRRDGRRMELLFLVSAEVLGRK